MFHVFLNTSAKLQLFIFLFIKSVLTMAGQPWSCRAGRYRQTLPVVQAGETGSSASPGGVWLHSQHLMGQIFPSFIWVYCTGSGASLARYMTFGMFPFVCNELCSLHYPQAYLLSSQSWAKLFSLEQPKTVELRSRHSEHPDYWILGATSVRAASG